MTRNALIGATGFVGSNIYNQGDFNFAFSSSNIQEIVLESYDLLVCAGARAEKWKANRDPEVDYKNIMNLISWIERISVQEFILISTVDVYPDPLGVCEDSTISEDLLTPYGKHRFLLEKFVRGHFKDHKIIRLPGLFGKGLKKNFIFDMLHNPDALVLTHSESKYQFYSLDSIWQDIQSVQNSGLPLVNFATPPLSIKKIATECFGTDISLVGSNQPVTYDMRTRYAWIFNQPGEYICSEEIEIAAIKKFVRTERKSAK
jgi:nucleoside-diphosphate-sugar epimerase